MPKLKLKPKDRTQRGRLRITRPEQQHTPGRDSSGERFKPTDEHRAQVEALAAFGIPQDSMRSFIINPRTGRPITAKTLAKHFSEELELGLSKAIATVANCLYELATTPNPSQLQAC